jgi:cysteine desulfurase
MIYLDHNATTNIHPSVRDKIITFYDQPLNASAIHNFGRQARKILDVARNQLAKLLGIEQYFSDYQITFTASGTEANNLVLSNFMTPGSAIFISKVEHASIASYASLAANVQLIDVDQNGIIDLSALEYALSMSKAEQKIVSVMLANNEFGAIEPIARVAQIAHRTGALVHSDCVQAIGKIKVDLRELDIDFASVSAHKFGGPIGAGALIAKSNYQLKPLIIGGNQEKNLRAGTENIIAIAGFGHAAAIAAVELTERYQHLRELQLQIEFALLAQFPLIKIVSQNVPRLPNTSLIIHPGKRAETQLIALDLQGVALSAGSACSSGKVASYQALTAMGYSSKEAQSAIRISTGINTTVSDINNFLTIYNNLNSNIVQQ